MHDNTSVQTYQYDAFVLQLWNTTEVWKLSRS